MDYERPGQPEVRVDMHIFHLLQIKLFLKKCFRIICVVLTGSFV